MTSVPPLRSSRPPATPTGDTLLEVHFFYHSGCPHCRDQEPFNEEMALKYENVYFVYHDGADPGPSTQFCWNSSRARTSPSRDLDFPATIVGNKGFVGWQSREVNGPLIEQAISGLPGGQLRWKLLTPKKRSCLRR